MLHLFLFHIGEKVSKVPVRPWERQQRLTPKYTYSVFFLRHIKVESFIISIDFHSLSQEIHRQIYKNIMNTIANKIHLNKKR